MALTHPPRAREISGLDAALAVSCPACRCSPCGCLHGGGRLTDFADALRAAGYTEHPDPLHADAASRVSCDGCGSPFSCRTFRLWDDRAVLAVRTYAVCGPCGRWVEF